MCRDSDEVAYGNRLVVVVDSWPKEEYRVIDLDTPLSDSTRARLPLYFYFHRYGWKVIHWFAAAVGCDVSANGSGMVSVGRALFMKALRSFDAGPVTNLNPRSFAVKLQEFALPSCRLK